MRDRQDTFRFASFKSVAEGPQGPAALFRTGKRFGCGCQKEREKSNSCEFQSSLRFFAPTDNESIKVQGGGGACIQAQVQVLAMGVLINKLQNWGLLAGEGLVKTVCYTAVYAAACCIEFLGYFVFYLVVGALSGGVSF